MRIVVKDQTPVRDAQEVIDILLRNRGITHSESFFEPPDPASFGLQDLNFSREYIQRAFDLIFSLHPSKKISKHTQESNLNNERPHNRTTIVVWCDYDADGITGGAILWRTLHLLGFTVFPYISDRVTEGYGFSRAGLIKIREKYNPGLIVSVDHGISAREEVAYAVHELGIPVIVTDHHHRQESKVPSDACAIFHVPELSGSSTAYYVAKEIAHELIARLKETDVNYSNQLALRVQQLFRTDFLSLAAIGTIADLVPLVGVARAIAKYGLDSLSHSQCVGIQALKEVSGNIGKTVTTFEVGFMLAPRINASGRISDPLDALRLLCTTSYARARQLATILNELNTTRQDMVKQATEEASRIVESKRDSNGELPKLLIIYQNDDSPAPPQNNTNSSQTVPSTTANSSSQRDRPFASSWHEGIIGLIASRICERYTRPVLVLTRTDGHYKASARSVPGFHLTDFLARFEDMLVTFGGHAAAAGFTILSHRLPEFEKKAFEFAQDHLSSKVLAKTISVDLRLPTSLVTHELAEKIEMLSPFGVGNEKPLFLIQGRVEKVRMFGKVNQYIKLQLEHLPHVECVFFRLPDKLPNVGESVEIVGHLKLNHWNGKKQARVVGVEVTHLQSTRKSYSLSIEEQD
jgi:single-stranded-DNA-specific exonuclease